MDAMSLPGDDFVLIGALLLLLGVVAAGAAERARVPGLLVFLTVGMAIGDDGLNLLSLSDPEVAQFGAVIALVMILFEGGLTTKPGDVRRALGPGLVLATVGVVVTAGLTTLGAWLILDVTWRTALLIGAVVASTDAAAVFAVLRSAPLPRRLSALLEVESGSNDPAAIVLTLAVLATVEAPASAPDIATFAIRQLLGGVLGGVLFGVLGATVMRHLGRGPTALYPVGALALAGVAYGTTAALGASGFLAVYVVGLFVGALVPRHRRGIRQFHEGIANIAQIMMFLVLGLLVFPSRLPGVALPALAVAAVLVFIARPVAVWLCLPWFGFTPREVTLVSWAGLRGAVPIVLATFPLTAGVPGGQTIFDVVFFVVLISSVLQSSSVGFLARWLGLPEGPDVWAPIAEAVPLDGVDADLMEVDIVDGLAVSGQRIRDVPLPAGARLTAVLREDQVVRPAGETVLQPGDLVLVAVPRREEATAEMVAWARGEAVGWNPPGGAAGDQPEVEETQTDPRS